LSEISKHIPQALKIDVKDFKVTTSLVSVVAETNSVESANAITKALKEFYPSLRTGAVSACAGKADCKSFTFEFEREKGT
jgi:hypothetical protein